MAPHRNFGPMILGLTLGLIFDACKEPPEPEKQRISHEVTVQTKIDSAQETEDLPPTIVTSKDLAVLADTVVDTLSVDIDTSTPPNAFSPKQRDSLFATSYYYRQSILDFQKPPVIIERPSLQPDSQTWDQIAGIPQPRQDLPAWIKALGVVNGVAAILVFLYFLFID
jgi:hypothetical protein